MKTLLAVLLVLLPLVARGHIGSPNVFFDGQAGPHSIRVVIRPPAVVPGFAQADVRVAGRVTRVTVQPVFFGAPGGASAPIPATATAGMPGNFSASFWLLARGSYAVRISVEGPAGSGVAIVPLQIAALASPEMPAGVLATLLALGAVLLAGAIWIIRSAARESTLASAADIAARDATRGRRAAVLAVVVLGSAVWAGAVRWRKMDAEFRNNALARPVEVATAVRSEGGPHLLRITPALEHAVSTRWDRLVTDHGKLMHLFLIRDRASGPEAFAHLHPVRRENAAFEGVLPPLPGGNYQLYGEITYEDGRSETLTSRITLPESAAPARQAGWSMLDEIWCQSPLAIVGNAATPTALDYDDSWHVTPPGSASTDARTSKLMGGSRMIFHTPGELVANLDTSLRFTVVNSAGETVLLQPYMGMSGHAVIRKTDGEVFTHLHPLGTISMAAQQLLAGNTSPFPITAGAPVPEAREVTFPYAFPRPGNYQIWVQIRTSGRVLTGTFDVPVKEGP
jgi:hypothetical protein